MKRLIAPTVLITFLFAFSCEENESCETQCYDRDEDCRDGCSDFNDEQCIDLCDERLRSCLLGCENEGS